MKALKDPVFEMGEEESLTLQSAYFQLLVVKALLYFATDKGKRWLVPVPPMIAMLIVKAVHKWATNEELEPLPAHRSIGPQYPADMLHREGFWWEEATIHEIDKAIRGLPKLPHDTQSIVRWLISSEYSILHPKGLMEVRIGSWWPMRPCGAHRDNLMVSLQERHCIEVEEMVLPRLGEEYAQWCSEVGAEMARYAAHDGGVVSTYCGECHPTL